MQNRLRDLRKQRGLSLAQLAVELEQNVGLKVTPDALSKYERGERSPQNDVWSSIARYFEVDLLYLSGQIDAKESKKIKEKNQSLIDEYDQKFPELANLELSFDEKVFLYDSVKSIVRTMTWDSRIEKTKDVDISTDETGLYSGLADTIWFYVHEASETLDRIERLKKSGIDPEDKEYVGSKALLKMIVNSLSVSNFLQKLIDLKKD